MAKRSQTRAAAKSHIRSHKTSPVKAKRTSRARTAALSIRPATKTAVKRPVPVKQRRATRRADDRASSQSAMKNAGILSESLNPGLSPARTPLSASAIEKRMEQMPKAALDTTLHTKATPTQLMETALKSPAHGFKMMFMPLEMMVRHQAYVFNLMLGALHMQRGKKNMWQPFPL